MPRIKIPTQLLVLPGILLLLSLLAGAGVRAEEPGRLETIILLSKQSQVLSVAELNARKGFVSFGPKPSARTLIYLHRLNGVELNRENIGKILDGLKLIYTDAGKQAIRISVANPYPGSNALQIVIDDRILPKSRHKIIKRQNHNINDSSTSLEKTISKNARIRKKANPENAPHPNTGPQTGTIKAILLISDPEFYDLDPSFEHQGIAEFGAMPPDGLLSDLKKFIGTRETTSIDEISQLVTNAYQMDSRADLEIWIDPNIPPSGYVKILIGPKQADMITTIPKRPQKKSAIQTINKTSSSSNRKQQDETSQLKNQTGEQTWVFGELVIKNLNNKDAEKVSNGFRLIPGDPIDLVKLQSDLDVLNRSPTRIFRVSYQPKSLSPPILDIYLNVSAKPAPRLRNDPRVSDQDSLTKPEKLKASNAISPIYKLRQYRVVGANRSEDANIKNRMSLLPGEEIDRDILRRDLYGLNKSPHRTVQMTFEQIQGRPELLDVVLTVTESRPVRFFGSIDNSGLERSGEYPADISLEWNHLGYWDHSLTYRFNSEAEFENIFGHTLNYLAISPLGHQLALTGQWSESISQTILPFGTIFTQTQFNKQISGKYTVPLVLSDSGLTIESYVGLEAKDRVFETRADGVLQARLHNRIYQFVPGFSVSKTGQDFAYSIDSSLTFSPGGLGILNSDNAFQSERIGTSADYLYGNTNLNFSYNFNPEWTLKGRLRGQISNARLLASEKISAGGNDTVRGFDNGAASGDYGAVASIELHLPSIDLSADNSAGKSMIRPFLFTDGAVLANLNRVPTEGTPQLLSAGIGFNYSYDDHLQITGNYGWQLINQNTGDKNHAKFFIRASFSF